MYRLLTPNISLTTWLPIHARGAIYRDKFYVASSLKMTINVIVASLNFLPPIKLFRNAYIINILKPMYSYGQ